ncbi:MAG: hypothetical protein ABSD74_18315 [Rhizomicrobium sp.]|jgi:hypothetical protein
MDIHRPKPFHGLREFLKEYGIIVLGVLTALALEQAVEAVRMSRDADSIERNFRTDLQYDLVAAAERAALAPCLQQRIAALRDKLAADAEIWAADPQTYADASKGGPDPLMPEAFHTPLRIWADSSWQAALGSPALNHLPQEARADFAAAFYNVEQLRRGQDAQLATESDLTALALRLRMTPELRAHYLDRLGELSREEDDMETVASQFTNRAKEMGVRADPANVRSLVARQRSFRGRCVRDVTP